MTHSMTIPNAGDAGLISDGQAVVDGRRIEVIAAGLAGDGVVRGCAVSVNTGTLGAADTLQVGSGIVKWGGQHGDSAADTTVSIAAADAADRIDLVTVDVSNMSAATIAVVQGTAENYVAGTSAPSWPDIPDDRIVLTAIWVPGSATTLTADNLTDCRAIIHHTGRLNALSPVTGISGDGSEDYAAIETMLQSGKPGSTVVFPKPLTKYFIGSSISAIMSTDVDVLCHADAIFEAGAVDGDLFDWDTDPTNEAFGLSVGFKWVGGRFHVHNMLNSNSAAPQRDVGLNQEGTVATTDVFSFRNGRWSSIVVEDVTMVASPLGATSGVPGGTLADYSDPAYHWMGYPTDTAASGADSGIYINSGPGIVALRNLVGVGLRDTFIYISGENTTPAPAATEVSGCRVFWCGHGISAKSDAARVVVRDNYLYGCYVGIQGDNAAAGAGPTNMIVTDNIVEVYGIAYRARVCTDMVFEGNKALNGGYLDWFGEATHADGKVTLNGADTSGQIDGITVNGVQIMDGTSVAYATSTLATARAIRDNINGHTSTPNYLASVREDPNNAGDYHVQIQNATAGNDADGFAVAHTGSGALSTNATDTAMAYAWSSPVAYRIEGSQGTIIDGAIVKGTSTDWATSFPNDRPLALDVRSIDSTGRVDGGADRQTLDTFVTGLVIDGVRGYGNEVTVAGVSDPDRTQIQGVMYGDDLDTYAAPTLLGTNSWINFGIERTQVLSADHTVDSTTAARIGNLGHNVKNGQTWKFYGVLFLQGEQAQDMALLMHGEGTPTGWFGLRGPSVGSTGNAGSVSYLAQDPESQISFGTIGQVDNSDRLAVEFYGIMNAVADGLFEPRMRLANSGTAGVIFDDSFVEWKLVA